MKRIEFKLGMPSNNSWDGKWSGADRNYTIVRRLTDAKAIELLKQRRFTHAFGDGWVASVDVRELAKGERPKKSDGFCGYDWMVTNIIANGQTREPAKTSAPIAEVA